MVKQSFPEVLTVKLHSAGNYLIIAKMEGRGRISFGCLNQEDTIKQITRLIKLLKPTTFTYEGDRS